MILKTRKVESPPSRVQDLKAEKRDLERRIVEKEAELVKINEAIKNKSWNLSHMEPARQKAGEIAISRLREDSDILMEELREMNKDLKVITNSLTIATREENEARAQVGQGEIASKLAALVEKVEAAEMANLEYYELRKSFKNPGHSWPYSCGKLDTYQIRPWLRDAKKFLGKEK